MAIEPLGDRLPVVSSVSSGGSWRDAGWHDRWVRLGWSIAIVIGVGILFAPPALVLLSLLMAPFLREQSDALDASRHESGESFDPEPASRRSTGRTRR